jgi:hypothetical protein
MLTAKSPWILLTLHNTNMPEKIPSTTCDR